MGIFSWNKQRDELVLVFYVGSSFVGGSLFWAKKSGIPKIIFSTSELISLEDNIEAEQLLSSTLKTLEIVAKRIYDARVGAPEAIFCVLSPLWYVSQTRIIGLKKNTPFVFSSKLAEELLQKEVALFEEEHLAKYLHSSVPVRLIEFKNIRTMLNGYETPVPLNQKIKELEMTVFISMCGGQILNNVEEIIQKRFHFKEIKFSSFALSSFAVVRDMYPLSENFLLISIGGEITDISMTKKNILRESISFPLGISFIVRGVASALHCSLAEAKSYISLFKDGHAAEPVANTLNLVISKLRKEWLMKFQESLSNLSNDISVPSTIYLTVDKDLTDFFSETIKTEQFNQYTLTESKFSIIPLGAEVFHGLATFEENVIRNPFLIIGAIYTNRFLINSVRYAEYDAFNKV